VASSISAIFGAVWAEHYAATKGAFIPPVKRWGVAEDFGGIAVYIMSDASSHHTGDTFIIDGGYSIF